jgi:NhaP-type Na+/H+ or K+/H+ antiporter/rhodanese-related sulfurtransferase
VLVTALVGIVIIVATLLSGLIERSNVPQVAVFLALGTILGPYGLRFLDIGLDSPILRVVATLSLALVLFTDAVSLSIAEVRQHAKLAALVLGPGTLVSAALIGFASWKFLGLPAPASAILGAALASTDPVLLRGLLRRDEIPSAARQALRLESGLNDVVLLPIVVIAMWFLGGREGGASHLGHIALSQFLLGPAAGVGVGLLGVSTMDMVRRKLGIRRDYESIYSLGICFAAFAAAEAVHGSGFLAAFAAGLTIAALDVELCDCFLEYGENTAEMALLFTFVLLGAGLIWSGFGVMSWHTVLFALFVIAIRPLVYIVSLSGAKLDRKSLLLISWFGPRGLSSILLVLLPVFAGLPGAGELFRICCLVVVFSVALHGGSLMLLGRRIDAAASDVEATPTAIPETETQPLSPRIVTEPAIAQADASQALVSDGERITVAETVALQESGATVDLLDARSVDAYGKSDRMLPGSTRIDPSRPAFVVGKAAIPKESWLVAFCTCPNDETSMKVAADLRRAGYVNARALAGGWEAWLDAGLPTVARGGMPETTKTPQPSDDGERIALGTLVDLRKSGEQVYLLDARRRQAFSEIPEDIPNTLRVDPARPAYFVEHANIPKDARIVAICSCPDDKTSMRVAEDLRRAGYARARALTGGWSAWVDAGLPTQPRNGREDVPEAPVHA